MQDEVDSDANDCGLIQCAFLQENVCWLKVIVEGADPVSVWLETLWLGDALQMDEDSSATIVLRQSHGHLDEPIEVGTVSAALA